MAGSVPTIQQRITLDGAEDISRQLRDLGQTGERAFKQIQNAGGSLGDGGRQAADQLKKLGLQGIEARKSADGVRDSIHVLHPVLDSLGLRFGNLSSYARLATAGMTAFGVATGAGVVVALEKLVDKATVAKKALSELGFSPAQTSQIARGAAASGVDLGTVANRIGLIRAAGFPTAAQLAPQFAGETTLDQLIGRQYFAPGSGGPGPQGANQLSEFLRKAFAAGVGQRTAGGEALDKFLPEFARSHGLTPEGALGLDPGVARLLAQTLGVNVGAAADPRSSLAAFISRHGQSLAGHKAMAAGVSEWTPEQFTAAAQQASIISPRALLGAAQENPKAVDAEFAKLQGQPTQLADAMADMTAATKKFAEDLGKVKIDGFTISDVIERIAKGLTLPNLEAGMHALAHPIDTAKILSPNLEAGVHALVHPTQTADTLLGLKPGSSEYALTGEKPPGGVGRLSGSGTISLGELQAMQPGAKPPAAVAPPAAAKPPATALPAPQIDPQYKRWLDSLGKSDDALAAEQEARRAQWKKEHPGQPLPQGFALGGTIRGPGTGTSDSITMALSPGGFVLNASATSRLARVSNGERYFTPEETGRIGLGNLMAINQHLADGGEIDTGSWFPSQRTPSLPSAPNSGGSGSGSPIHLTLASGHTVSGTITGEEIVRKLRHESVRYQQSRAGKVPGWYG